MNRPAPASRTWVWLQLLLGWLPVWALYTLMVSPANPIHGGTPAGQAIVSGLIAVAIAALLGLAVQRLIERVPWTYPVRPRFLAVHLGAAAAYSATWVLLKQVVESVIHPFSHLSFHSLLLPNLILGVWLYVMVAGISYAVHASQRAALAEASAARSQLAALRGQLNPHFLFNALHTVVQLIPRDPRGAASAAELIAGLLRTTLEEDRDIVTLAEERAFVERYLELERIRFGDRLRVSFRTSGDAEAALLPSFALQTLVENAVRHGAAPQVEPTDIEVEGSVRGATLTLTVHDTGAGIAAGATTGNGGTGLQRLRERLAALYGRGARLELETGATGGFTASLSIPQSPDDRAEGR
jgi:sensor histidine kinase YesM